MSPPSPPAPDFITAVAPPDGSSSTTAAPKKKRAPRKRSAPSTEGEVEGGDSAPPKKKRTYRKRQPPAAEEGEAAAAAEGGEEVTQPKKAPRPRKRAPTPEDPENQEVDHSTTKMAELTRDLGIGKPFKHAEAIAERARLARMAAKQRKLDKKKRAMGLLLDDEAGANSRSGTPTAGNVGEGGGVSGGADMAAAGAVDTGAGVGYEVVDGQIVVNQSSLVVDRHAGQETQNLETVEEDEFSHQTTAASYRRPSRNVANAWTEEETERFYRLLGMFGTDFESIAAMFPGKNRRMVKCKFNREERLRPRRINAAVMVRGTKPVPIDLEEYKGFRQQWQETEDILREHERLAEEHRRDIQRLKAERRAQGLADDSDEEGGNEKAGDGPGAGGDGAQGDGVDAAAVDDGGAQEENTAAMSVETEVTG
ncbi:hypothetical protein SLS62_009749 [Diatrype stigma]|uniref:Myb-like domain-containing protein n=1 Tax=Diatrype stigma TaxID=117547 RepID=A0AAN9YIT2_9PEZI